MYIPVHPGEFITENYLKPNALNSDALANRLDIAPTTLERVLHQEIDIGPAMAIKLSRALGRSPESWLAMQNAWDLWQASHAAPMSGGRKMLEN